MTEQKYQSNEEYVQAKVAEALAEAAEAAKIWCSHEGCDRARGGEGGPFLSQGHRTRHIGSSSCRGGQTKCEKCEEYVPKTKIVAHREKCRASSESCEHCGKKNILSTHKFCCPQGPWKDNVRDLERERKRNPNFSYASDSYEMRGSEIKRDKAALREMYLKAGLPWQMMYWDEVAAEAAARERAWKEAAAREEREEGERMRLYKEAYERRKVAGGV